MHWILRTRACLAVLLCEDKYNMRPELPHDDHEGEMARSLLLRLAKYSTKLFNVIKEEQELEGWVQAKITKAADYISAVYHHLEYEQMARNQIESGPRDYKDQIKEEVKQSLSSRWADIKQGK